MKLLSVQEYADQRGVARQYVLKNIKRLNLLHGVISAQKVGKTWILSVDENKSFKADKPNKPNTGKTLKKSKRIKKRNT